MTGGMNAAHLTILHEIQNAILNWAQDAASTNRSNEQFLLRPYPQKYAIANTQKFWFLDDECCYAEKS